MLLHYIPMENLLSIMKILFWYPKLSLNNSSSSSLHVLSFILLVYYFSLSFQSEISLCRVYKRAGFESHPPVMHKPSSSKSTRPDKKCKRVYQPSSLFTALAGGSSPSEIEKIHEEGVCSAIPPVSNVKASLKQDGISLNSSKTLIPITSTLLPSATSSLVIADEFNKTVSYHQGYLNQTNQFITMPSQPQLLPLNGLPNSLATISDKLWECNQIQEAGKNFTSFK